MTEEKTAIVKKRIKIMEKAHEHIQKIYRESLDVVTEAVIFNSLFFFVFMSALVGVVLLCQVGCTHVREAYKRRLEQEARIALIDPDFAAVAV